MTLLMRLLILGVGELVLLSFDPLTWSADALTKRRRQVHAVRDQVFLPRPPGIWGSEWVNVPASAICAEDIAHWPYTPGLLVKWVSF